MSSGIAEEEIKDGSGWHLGGWTVDPDALELIDDTGKHVRLEARTMRMLQLLHERGGEVVTTEEMLEQIWSDKVVTPHSIAGAVSELRKALGPGSTASRSIETIPKRGYRLVEQAVAAQTPMATTGENSQVRASIPHRPRTPHWYSYWPVAATVLGAVAALAAISWMEYSDSRRGSAAHAVDSSITAQYVRARQLWSEREQDTTLAARDLLEDITKRAPDFAPAHAALADIYAHKTGADLNAPELETFREAQRELDKARAIDPRLPESYVTQALLDFYRDAQPRKALASVAVALDKDPRFAYAWQTRAMLLSAVGENTASLAAIDRARRLDPASQSIGSDEIWFLYLAGDYERAHRAWDRESQRSAPSYLYGALIEQARGHARKALQLWVLRLKARDVRLSNPSAIDSLAEQGETEAAYGELLRQVATEEDYHESPVVLAIWQLLAGDVRAAERTLATVTPDRSDWLAYWVQQIPVLSPIRQYQRLAPTLM